MPNTCTPVGRKALRTRRPTLRASLLAGSLCLLLLAAGLLSPSAVFAQEGGAPAPAAQDGAPLGAAIAVGLACIGAGIAVGIAGAAAIGGITERPETFGRSLIFVGLAEGIAIYGLIIAFIILTR